MPALDSLPLRFGAPLVFALGALAVAPVALAAPPAAPPPVAAAPAPAPPAPPTAAPLAPAPAPAPPAAPAPAAEAPAPEAAPPIEGPVEVEVEDEDGDGAKVVIADEGAKVTIVVKEDGDDEVIKVIDHHHHHHHELHWAGFSMSSVFSLIPSSGRVSETQGRLNSNAFRACVRPGGEKTCGYVKGLDFKVQVFEANDGRDYPRAIGYFRSGFNGGRISMDSGENDFLDGQVTELRYVSVPLFFGGNVYAFKDFPVRPYGGLGAGFDILRLDYRRQDQAAKLDASARIGFELHAGVEARITNFVSLHVEVMQLWSARRKVDDVPDFSGTGLSMLGGVAVAIPTNLREFRRHQNEHATRTTARRSK